MPVPVGLESAVESGPSPLEIAPPTLPHSNAASGPAFDPPIADLAQQPAQSGATRTEPEAAQVPPPPAPAAAAESATPAATLPKPDSTPTASPTSTTPSVPAPGTAIPPAVSDRASTQPMPEILEIPEPRRPSSSREMTDPAGPDQYLKKPGSQTAPDPDKEIEKITGSRFLDIENTAEEFLTGLPSGKPFYTLKLDQALSLGLVNSRAYQFRVENIYLSALAVTLQRFNLQPQFYAGFSPSTGPTAGGILGNGSTNLNYRTQEAPGGQISSMSLSSVAGVGKVFAFGGRMLASFANTTVFNFIGANPRQPTVSSQLPISFVLPLLRGGGRAVTLEPLTQAERSLLYEIRSFARFRQQFFTNIITGGGVDNPGLADPSIGYLTILAQMQGVENSIRTVNRLKYTLSLGAEISVGDERTPPQNVDQVNTTLQSNRIQLVNTLLQYRNQLDQYKMQLGMPPDVSLVLDRGPIEGFRSVFDEIDAWSESEVRKPEDLTRFVRSLPKFDDILIDGKSFNDGANDMQAFDDFLTVAVRVALENRLDLMNARAQLYDAWRQYAVTANALRGILNVTLTNTVFTPPTTSNPFAFVDQAKQFNLVLNTELPLIRVSERNNFVTARINFQRQQRALMNAEDQIKLSVRTNLRTLVQLIANYELQKRTLLLNLRNLDNAREKLREPAAQAGASGGTLAQIQAYLNAQNGILNASNSLIGAWVNFQSSRLSLYRDLGTMPYDEWEAYYELFAPKSQSTRAGERGGVGDNADSGAGAPGPGTRPVGSP